MTQIRCPACGWENEAGARICGGCGRPLSGPSGSLGYSPRGYDARGSAGASGMPDATDPDMPTAPDVPRG